MLRATCTLPPKSPRRELSARPVSLPCCVGQYSQNLWTALPVEMSGTAYEPNGWSLGDIVAFAEAPTDQNMQSFFPRICSRGWDASEREITSRASIVHCLPNFTSHHRTVCSSQTSGPHPLTERTYRCPVFPMLWRCTPIGLLLGCLEAPSLRLIE